MSLAPRFRPRPDTPLASRRVPRGPGPEKGSPRSAVLGLVPGIVLLFTLMPTLGGSGALEARSAATPEQGGGMVAPAAAGPGSQSPYASLAAKAEALVTVTYVAEFRAPGLDREAEAETTCLGIDPKGLVVCSNTEVGGYFDVLARLMGRSGDVISARPRAVRIQVGDDPEGWPATVIARDSDRDLAWIQVDSMPEDAVLPSIDLEQRAEAEVGQRFYQLRLLDRFFGSAPVVSERVVGAIIDQPRRLIVPTDPGGGLLGMPAFTADGRLLGLTVAQVPEAGESQAVMGDRRRSLPGQEDAVDDMVGGILLPADDLLRATRLAREVWAADREGALE